MPSTGSQEREPCLKCGRPVWGHRWQVAIVDSPDSDVQRERLLHPPGEGWWYWGTVCTPCHVALRASEGVLYLEKMAV